MAIRRSGVEFVAKNVGGFLKSVERVNKSYSQISNSSKKAARDISSLADKVARAGVRYENAQLRTFRSDISAINAKNRLEIATIGAQRASTKLRQAVSKYGKTSDQAKEASGRLRSARLREEIGAYNLQVAVQNYIAAALDEERAKEELAAATAQYNAAQNQSISIISALTTTMKVLGVALAALGIAFAGVVFAARGITRVFGAIVESIKTMIGWVKKAASSLLDLFKRAFDATAGRALSAIFREISKTLSDMGREAAFSVGEFQRLQLQFRALLARDIAERFGGTVADAMQEASIQAQQLLQWVAKLAVTTPFDILSISRTLAFGNAMGLSIGQAQTLTKSIITFASAMGLTEDHMERIIYNFGQMISQGKLTGREFRDLAISFVPAARILKELPEASQKTWKELQKMAYEGTISVEQFFAKFVELVERDFSGAAQDMARTITGVINNLKDFFQFIVGFELLGPTFNKITEVAANALDKLLSPSVREAAHLIGEVLLRAFVVVRPFVDALGKSIANLAKQFGLTLPTTNAVAKAIAFVAVLITRILKIVIDRINDFSKTIGSNFSGLQENMGKWGLGMIAALAQGMARGAQLVVKVITYIAKIISSLLRTSSPPPILPDLPKWGMEAMEEWLRGFALADFDALEGIQSPLKQALDLLARTGQISKGQVGTIYRDVSMALAKAISTGEVDQSLFDFIQRSLPVWGEQIAELAQKHIELAEAVKAVKAAEEALESARKAEQDARVKISEQVREYNRLIRSGVDKAILNARLTEINASEEAARLATEQRKQAEVNLEQAEKQAEALREQVEVLEKIVNQLLEITEAQIIDIDSGGASDEISELGEQLKSIFDFEPELPGLPEDVTSEIDKIFKDAQDSVDSFLLTMKLLWNQSFGPLSPFAQTWENMKTSLGEVSDLWDAFLGRVGAESPDLSSFGFGDAEGPPAPRQISTLERLLEIIKAIGKNIASTEWSKFTDAFGKVDWTSLGNSILNILEGLGKVEIEKVADAISWLVDAVLLIKDAWPSASKPGNLGLQFLLGPLYYPLRFLVDKLVPFANKVGGFLKEKVIQPVIDAFQWLYNRLIGGSIIPELVNGIIEWWNKLQEWASSIWSSIANSIIEPIASLRERFVEIWFRVRENASEWWGNITTAITTKISEWRTSLSTTLEEVRSWVSEKWESFWNDASTWWDNIKNTAITKLTELSTLLATNLNLMKTKWDEVWNAIRAKIDELFVNANNIKEKIKKAIDDIITKFESDLADAINWFKNSVLEPLRSKFQNVIDKVSSLTGWLGSLASAIRNVDIGKILELLGIKIKTPKTTTTTTTKTETRTALGGKALAGQLHKVGEQGWEWFVPAVNGYILNQRQAAHQLASISASMSPNSVSRVPSVSKVINFNMGGMYISRDVDSATLIALIRTTIRQEFS